MDQSDTIGKVLKINCPGLTEENKYSAMYELNNLKLGEGLTLGLELFVNHHQKQSVQCYKTTGRLLGWKTLALDNLYKYSLCTIT